MTDFDPKMTPQTPPRPPWDPPGPQNRVKMDPLGTQRTLDLDPKSGCRWGIGDLTPWRPPQGPSRPPLRPSQTLKIDLPGGQNGVENGRFWGQILGGQI